MKNNQQLLSPPIHYFLITILTIIIPFSLLIKGGITWDEPFYLFSGRSYFKWFMNLKNYESFSYKTILDYFITGHEHPPFTKFLFGLFNYYFSDFIGFLTSARFVNLIFALLFNLNIFHFLKNKFSSFYAWITILIIFSFNQYNSYAAVATLDFSLAVCWNLSLIYFYKSLKNKRFFIPAAFFFCLANLIKFNAVFIIITFMIWGLICFRKIFLKKILFLFLLSVSTLIILWPWMYHNTTARLAEYLINKTGRIKCLKFLSIDNSKDSFVNTPPSKVPVHYLGKTYKGNNYPAPFHYPFVLFNTTIPLFFILLLYAGIFKILFCKPRSDFLMLVLINTFTCIFIFTLPFLPKYGGIRFLLPSYPTAAMLITEGILLLQKRFSSRKQIGMIFILIIFTISLSNTFLNRSSLNASYNLLIRNPLSMPVDNTGILLNTGHIEKINNIINDNKTLAIKGTGSFTVDLYKSLSYFREEIIIGKSLENADYLLIIPNLFALSDKELNIFHEKDKSWEKIPIGSSFVKFFKRKSVTVTT